MRGEFSAAEQRLLREASSRAARFHGVRRGAATGPPRTDVSLAAVTKKKSVLLRLVFLGKKVRLTVSKAAKIYELKDAIASQLRIERTSSLTITSALSVDEFDEWGVDERVGDVFTSGALVRVLVDHPLYDACRAADGALANRLLADIDGANNFVRRNIVMFALGREERLTPVTASCGLRPRLALRAGANSRIVMMHLALYLLRRPSSFEDDCGHNAIAWACARRLHSTALQLLRMNLRCRVDGGEVDGATPLQHVCAAGGMADVAFGLLLRGANVNRRIASTHGAPQHGWTALMVCVHRDCVATARVLLRFGADLSCSAPDGRSAFDMCREGSAMQQLLADAL